MNLQSKTIRMRFAEESDAAFILSLRLDERYNQFLSEVGSDIEAQKAWLRNYKKDEAAKRQFYFIIERLDGTPCGTVRVYDLRDDSFCWGSWILNENKTRFSAIESAFLVYDFGFNILNYKKAHFDVRKDNKAVISFHEKMGAQQTSESDTDAFFEITKDAVLQKKEQLKSKLI